MDKKIKLETIITSLTLLKENKGFVNGIILDYIFNIHRQSARLIESRRRGKPTRLLLNSSRKTRLGTAAPDVLKTLSFLH